MLPLPLGGDAVAQGRHLQVPLVAGGSFSQLGPVELVGVGAASRGCLGCAARLPELQHTTKGWSTRPVKGHCQGPQCVD